jgi:hypothetical protein
MFVHKEVLYENGMTRYKKEMDIVSLLKSVRISKMLYRNVLNREERILMQLQRTSVISSDSSEDPETDYGNLFSELKAKE